MRTFALFGGACAAATCVCAALVAGDREAVFEAKTPNLEVASERARPSSVMRARDEETREEAARNELRARVESADGLEDRLDVFLVATLGSRATVPDAAQRGALLEYFLRQPSVQSELSALPELERAEALAGLRRRLGFSEEQVARFRLRDARQAARWENGLAYMRARTELESKLSGEALETALLELRRARFQDSAETIRREEESGFFRFERPRILGRN